MLSKEDTWEKNSGTEKPGNGSDDTNVPRDAGRLQNQIVAGHDNKYRLLELIGRGGSGDVYKAKVDVQENENSWVQTQGSNTTRIVACKVLLERLLDNKQHYKRFQHEARLAKRLIHPNIVNVHDAGETDGRPFIVLDYLEGTPLSDICEGEVRVPAQRALPIFLQISKAFAYAHLNNIIHRDLKPSNIMLIRSKGRDDFVKVVDFGIAKMITETTVEATKLTKTGEIFGSPLYMSPEQCRGEKLDVRSDIYSFGILMYEVLTGTTPFKGTDTVSTMYKHTTEAPKSIAAVDGDALLAKKLEKIIFKCLEKDPPSRYQTMDDLTRDLELVQADLDEIRSGKKNKISLASQRIWLFLSRFTTVAATKLLSRRLSSGGLTVGSISAIVLAVLVLIGTPGLIFLFGSPIDTNISNRELPFKPIVDTSIQLTDQKLAESAWAKIQSSSMARWAPFLESALAVFLRVADSAKKAGNYEVARWWYYRSELVLEWLKMDKSIEGANVYNSYAESCLLANTVLDAPDAVQKQQLKELINKSGVYLNPQVLRDNGLIYAANAATARDASLTALGKLRELTTIESSNKKSFPQELSGNGLAAESFLELGDVEDAKKTYDAFYTMLSQNGLSAELDRPRYTYLLSLAAKFFLQQNDISKASNLLSRLQSFLTEFGSTANYELAVIYNDLGLVKLAENKNNEAEMFFKQSYAFLTASSQSTDKYKSVILNNMANASIHAGDFRSAIRTKFKSLGWQVN